MSDSALVTRSRRHLAREGFRLHRNRSDRFVTYLGRQGNFHVVTEDNLLVASDVSVDDLLHGWVDEFLND